ncbi:MAG TPA: tRNA (adenosine(37)-N6)-threonylcarbamoyltransferase complex ATPase subunit type 1 TsaE [Terriglobia bacterium]|nr:tRNA (adenosine(37)-N6)-threonylcarbamoyltransferase complex ATPase subunit type 1 TsaE [Terriglobia bacterium]
MNRSLERDAKLTPGGARSRQYDIVTHSPEETLAFGRKLATLVEPPCLVLMEGELGSGKTALTKGIVAGLGAAPETEVTSPTFALVHEYSGRNRVYHLDLYRIERPRDLATLGLDEMLSQDATVIVEWGERLGPNPPVPRVEMRLVHRGESERHIVVERITQNI